MLGWQNGVYISMVLITSKFFTLVGLKLWRCTEFQAVLTNMIPTGACKQVQSQQEVSITWSIVL
jgi:hypothetical protein